MFFYFHFDLENIIQREKFKIISLFCEFYIKAVYLHSKDIKKTVNYLKKKNIHKRKKNKSIKMLLSIHKFFPSMSCGKVIIFSLVVFFGVFVGFAFHLYPLIIRTIMKTVWFELRKKKKNHFYMAVTDLFFFSVVD